MQVLSYSTIGPFKSADLDCTLLCYSSLFIQSSLTFLSAGGRRFVIMLLNAGTDIVDTIVSKQ